MIFNVTKSSIGRDSDEEKRLLGDWRRLNVAVSRGRHKVIIVGTNEIADVRRLFYYFNLYMWAKSLGSVVRVGASDFRETLDRGVETEIDEAIRRSRSQAERPRKVVGLTPEEKRQLDLIRGRPRNNHLW